MADATVAVSFRSQLSSNQNIHDIQSIMQSNAMINFTFFALRLASYRISSSTFQDLVLILNLG